MGNFGFKDLGSLYFKDENGEYQKVGTLCEFSTTISPEPEPVCECECVSDGINIHISGADIDKIDNIEIWFKDKEDK